MKKAIALFFILIKLTACSTAQPQNRQANINSIFDKMELQGVDITKPLLYGYFFYDKDKSQLEQLRDELIKAGYKLVRLEKVEDQKFILHLEKLEIHSRVSLSERENQLEKLAEKFQIDSYDGWDVGNADATKPLIPGDTLVRSLRNKPDAVLYEIANGFYDNDSNAKAVVAFQLCIDRKYKTDTCFYKQGVSYLGLGQTDAGIAKLKASLDINPRYFKALFNLGVTYYDNGEYEKSIACYQDAAKIDPGDDRVYYGIAASQFVLGQKSEATQNCRMALKINPDNENAKALLVKLKK